MDLVLLSSIATGIAVFGLLMAIFDPWLFPPQPKLDAVRASVLSRERYERLVVAERPWWERVLAPVASRLAARMPGGSLCFDHPFQGIPQASWLC